VKKWARLGCVLVVVLAMGAVVASAGTSSSLFGTKFNVGQEITFKVENSTTWWWGCGTCCPDVTILGWRVASSAGVTVYSVIHDAAVSASIWQAAWAQTDSAGAAVAAGAYTLYVDTSAGTLSRCFTIYDPCNRCLSCLPCSTCMCQSVSSITNCSCRTTLVFVNTCTGGCGFPFPFPFFGGTCGCSSTPCGCGTPCGSTPPPGNTCGCP